MIGHGDQPVTCPQFEYPILVPPAHSYMRVSENNNEPISYKRKRYSPFFFMRLPSSPSTEYHYSEAQADFINTSEIEDLENDQMTENMTVGKRYSPFLRMWKHQ